MATIFTRIIKGEIPCYKVAESEEYFAFLDINPLAKGHVLVVSKEETDYIFDLSDNSVGGIMVFSKMLASAIEKVVDCERVGVIVLGLEVPHAHIHLVPINSESDISFSKKRVKMSDEEFSMLAEEIRNNIE